MCDHRLAGWGTSRAPPCAQTYFRRPPFLWGTMRPLLCSGSRRPLIAGCLSLRRLGVGLPLTRPARSRILFHGEPAAPSRPRGGAPGAPPRRETPPPVIIIDKSKVDVLKCNNLPNARSTELIHCAAWRGTSRPQAAAPCRRRRAVKHLYMHNNLSV